MAMVAIVAVLLTACGTSGRALRDPAPGATAPARKATATTKPAVVTPIGLSITSPAWPPGDPMPATFSCDGAGDSPPLDIGGAGGDVAELVVVVTDPDAAGRVHWVVAGLSPDGVSFPEGGVPPDAVVGQNADGQAQWAPACPPPGVTHTYQFTVYALPTPSGIEESTPAAEAEADVAAASTSAAVLTGAYTGKR